MGFLEDKTAIVTGAGQGVGRGIALALGDAGARVVVAGRTLGKLAVTVDHIQERGGTAVAVEADVLEPADIERLVATTLAEYSAIDILVNNAQTVPLGKLLEVDDEEFERGFRSGPLASLRLMRACHDELRGGGVVINLGSGSALRPDPDGLGAYAAIKEATRMLTRAAAWEWGPMGIRLLNIVPLAASPGMEWWKENFSDEYQDMLSSVPLGRVGDCETDIGRAVAWMCGPDAGYITGSTIMLDGGQGWLR